MQRSDLAPEFRLLLDASLPGRPVELPQKVDWEAFVRLVRRHRLAGVVLRSEVGMPTAVRERLRRRAQRASVHALRHAAAMLQVAAALERDGVPVLALKGAALSRRLFGDAGLRQVRDVDLLVRPACLDAAGRRLRALGFERRWPRIEPTGRKRAALLEREQHFDYCQAAAGIVLELHWRIGSWDAPALDWLWEHSSLLPWPGGTLREPDAQALLLLVVDHGARHCWFCLNWLSDAAILLARLDATSAATLAAAARRLRLTRALAAAAVLVSSLYRTDLPAALSGLIAEEPLAQPLAAAAVRALLGSEAEHAKASWRNRRYARALGMPPDRFLRPHDFDEVPLPDRLFWLYYPLRPLLWMRRRLRRRTGMDSAFERHYFSGVALYGDDFNPRQLRDWWDREQRGYFELAQAHGSYTYGHHACNRFHVYRHLRGRFPACLAFGCARGDDVAPLAGRVDLFVAVEPAEAWWSDRIGGTEARYRKPAPSGDLPVASASIDLAVCFSALHHVANASHVFAELVRVLRPGGLLAIREPISTMGDWRRPRRGLTADERGFPPGWLDARAQAHGLRAVRQSCCGFPLTTRLARWLRMGAAYNCPALVRLDAWISRLLRWNLHYHRDTVWKKIAPAEIVYIFQKPAAADPAAVSVSAAGR